MKTNTPKFKPGDYVVAVHETFGWGRIRPGDVGIVTATETSPAYGTRYRVKFQAQDGWAACDRDIQKATPAQRKKAEQAQLSKTPSAVTTAAAAGVSFDDLEKLMRDTSMVSSVKDFFDSGLQFDPRMAVTIDPYTGMAKRLDTPAKPASYRLPKHLKGLKQGVRVRVTEDNAYFAVGDTYRVIAIDKSDETVKITTDDGQRANWIRWDFITTDTEAGKVNFDSVILEEDKKQAIMATIKQVDNHELIFDQWGFGDVLEKGKAISMLFYGPPGTGKTLMAQAIADKLGKNLKIVGSAEIESSEPGQAERNIKAFFEGTDKNTVLLFDECDSLVYSREHVGSILAAQVNQLLSSLENFEGIVVFTTNRLGVLDEAFNRRLSLKLEFGMPTLEQRVKIWQRMFPKKAPLADDIDWERLAEVELSGGYIKNVVLRAARMAAAEDVKPKDKKIAMSHLIEALTDEAKSIIEFEEARKHNHTPRAMGGGMGVTRTATRGMGSGK